ncbi:YetF domain-containing protein [Virgibacillus xinjiangensis]|uniref:YetF domain-containing protein n=1 Tax=Virgibacillus xinjiangensis TaxID=393090 RepID=A0ABV7CRN3_9BACI
MELILRIAIGFVVLFGLARIMGRKEISQMTFFNFASAIAIGSLAANLVVSNALSIRNGIIALTGWALFTLLMDKVDINSKRARKMLNGDPMIVVKNGMIVDDAMRKSRLDIDSLKAMLRKKDIFSLAEVDQAVFETDGKLSVLKKESNLPITKGDMNIPPSVKKYPAATEVIADGRIISNNLEKLHLDENWLRQKLEEAGIQSTSDVFYAEVLQNGILYTDLKDHHTDK